MDAASRPAASLCLFFGAALPGAPAALGGSPLSRGFGGPGALSISRAQIYRPALPRRVAPMGSSLRRRQRQLLLVVLGFLLPNKEPSAASLNAFGQRNADLGASGSARTLRVPRRLLRCVIGNGPCDTGQSSPEPSSFAPQALPRPPPPSSEFSGRWAAAGNRDPEPQGLRRSAKSPPL